MGTEVHSDEVQCAAAGNLYLSDTADQPGRYTPRQDPRRVSVRYTGYTTGTGSLLFVVVVVSVVLGPGLR